MKTFAEAIEAAKQAEAEVNRAEAAETAGNHDKAAGCIRKGIDLAEHAICDGVRAHLAAGARISARGYDLAVLAVCIAHSRQENDSTDSLALDLLEAAKAVAKREAEDSAEYTLYSKRRLIDALKRDALRR